MYEHFAINTYVQFYFTYFWQDSLCLKHQSSCWRTPRLCTTMTAWPCMRTFSPMLVALIIVVLLFSLLLCPYSSHQCIAFLNNFAQDHDIVLPWWHYSMGCHLNEKKYSNANVHEHTPNLALLATPPEMFHSLALAIIRQLMSRNR